ncbi:MAG: hydrolase [Clostridiales Family XIII bacterium]|nr:hydrolase [Clostridiales Family XIII bacterium]
MAKHPDYTRDQAVALLKEYTKEEFHLLHAFTVEGVMRFFAERLGYGEDADFWAEVGLLHDLDFEMYPDEHCVKVQELLKARGAGQDLIHAVVSHGYGLSGAEFAPEHEMEKLLFAADELTGLIWACAIIRPSKSVQDLELKSVKKKYRNLNFAAGCSREAIERGAGMLGWDTDRLIGETILAMRSCEDEVRAATGEALA